MEKYLQVAAYIGKQKTKDKKPNNEEPFITIMELVKLAYISHGRGLVMDLNLLEGDRIETWPLGPVPVGIYKAYKNNTNGIKLYNSAFNKEGDNLDDDEKGIIDGTIEDYKEINPFVLSEITHQAGTPWTQIVEDKGLYAIIPDELIKEHYTALLESKND